MSEPFDLRASVSAALDLPEDARGTMCAEDGVSILELHAALVRYRQWLEAATRKEESAGWDASDSDIVLESALAAFDQAVTL
jgi:hypothetical protein